MGRLAKATMGREVHVNMDTEKVFYASLPTPAPVEETYWGLHLFGQLLTMISITNSEWSCYMTSS